MHRDTTVILIIGIQQCNWRDYTPYPNTIIRMAYGTYQGKELVVKDKIYKTTFETNYFHVPHGKSIT